MTAIAKFYFIQVVLQCQVISWRNSLLGMRERSEIFEVFSFDPVTVIDSDRSDLTRVGH